jgi:maltose phosphorylase
MMFCSVSTSSKIIFREKKKNNFEFYESFTVHESSLSPCVHSIQAALLDKMDMAYTFYLRTSRLDLDEHKQSGRRLSHYIDGRNLDEYCGRFGGMRIKDDTLHFSPKKNGKGIRLKLISETRF